MANYALKTRDLEHDFTSRHGYSRFTFAHLGSVLDYEINEPRSWFVERNGKVLNAYNFNSLRLNGVAENEIFDLYFEQF